MAPLRTAIETEFPYGELSRVAEAESWRKELNRPLSHIHKWWAQRLGSVFRGIVIGACAAAGEDIWQAFYRPSRFDGVTVYDPFMGSGTTVIEARKLGCRVIGRDINPVAYFLVRNAFSDLSVRDVTATFHAIEADTAPTILPYYETRLPDGRSAVVLYFFWVKTLPCPQCGTHVDLFDSRVVVRHAMSSRHSGGQGPLSALRYHPPGQHPPGAGALPGLQQGVRAASRHRQGKPCHLSRMSAHFCHGGAAARSMVRPRNGCTRRWSCCPTAARCTWRRPTLTATSTGNPNVSWRERGWYPVVRIEPGHNTNQALRYNYTHWHTMFNARQLLCLGHLARRIARIEDEGQRFLFSCLFSSTLEFNNRFASFKGEGTGAVRHMFAHHVLKPERTPLEANVWGTPRSSGAFSTLFRSRLHRALDYRDAPFELAAVERRGRVGGRKVYGLSEPIQGPVAESYEQFVQQQSPVYLSCGNSARTDIADGAVDVVVTDPPFFDNVHYSELADFFHVWQRHILGPDGPRLLDTTRRADEVQNGAADRFAQRLGEVFRESNRVLKANGLMAFTYHHSRPAGWQALLAALHFGRFHITAVYPIKAEMSVGRPKLQAQSNRSGHHYRVPQIAGPRTARHAPRMPA